jgi:[ribosomal protein S18]-alanine N-acetyltransferase
MTFSIRVAAIGDLLGMTALEKHAPTAAHWSAAQYEDLFRGSGAGRVALIMEEDGLQGFVIARVMDKEWEIENIAVAGPARRRGLGTRLLGELLNLARVQNAAAVFLEVRESNQAARAFYEKWAFVESGRRRGYYRDPEEDAILYRFSFV